jgi:hypothetical protein
MSIPLTELVYKKANLRGSEKAMLAYLAFRTNKKKGYAWPAIETMGAELGFVPNMVRKIIRNLVAKGYLRVERTKTGGAGHTHSYFLVEERLHSDGGFKRAKNPSLATRFHKTTEQRTLHSGEKPSTVVPETLHPSGEERKERKYEQNVIGAEFSENSDAPAEADGVDTLLGQNPTKQISALSCLDDGIPPNETPRSEPPDTIEEDADDGTAFLASLEDGDTPNPVPVASTPPAEAPHPAPSATVKSMEAPRSEAPPYANGDEWKAVGLERPVGDTTFQKFYRDMYRQKLGCSPENVVSETVEKCRQFSISVPDEFHHLLLTPAGP